MRLLNLKKNSFSDFSVHCANCGKCKKSKNCFWIYIRDIFSTKKNPGRWNLKTWLEYLLPLNYLAECLVRHMNVFIRTIFFITLTHLLEVGDTQVMSSNVSCLFFFSTKYVSDIQSKTFFLSFAFSTVCTPKNCKKRFFFKFINLIY